MDNFLEEKRLFFCTVCKTSFFTYNFYISHMRIHWGMDIFVCDVCKGSYSQINYLISHMKIHRAR
ncbi:zinc finger protein 2 [Aphis craccivora]|uniref:Zinc finger protein 2 n=1 Tax=Aphis craccivora TaxID=307492 RepID=A0A6G0ZML9_APHCR|nr:zinc finger protein 2 [Aphis craccivora]